MQFQRHIALGGFKFGDPRLAGTDPAGEVSLRIVQQKATATYLSGQG